MKAVGTRTIKFLHVNDISVQILYKVIKVTLYNNIVVTKLIRINDCIREQK